MSEGKKYDGGKAPLFQGCFGYFPKALAAVAEVSAYGCKKYDIDFEDKNWKRLEKALVRYLNANARHSVRPLEYDPESKLIHAAHAAWNSLASLELILEEGATLHEEEG